MLYHYIIVQRGLPIGVTLAQVAHAAGESFAAYIRRGSSEKERPVLTGGSEVQVLPAAPHSPAHLTMGVTSNGEDALKAAGGAIPTPHVVVLGARNEWVLWRLSARLHTAGIGHVGITEPDEPYNGALMALGFWPAERESVRPFVEKFQIYAG